MQTRILLLRKWLIEETDYEHQLGCCEILGRWEQIGIKTDRRSVYKDIDTLKELGLDIQCERRKQNYYYVAEKQFELAELKLLVDAVEASQIIPKKETEDLVKKLTSFASEADREELSRPVIVDKVFKNTNAEVLTNTDLLYQAIRKRKKVSFQYYDYMPNKKKILKHNGKVYILSPYFLKWNSDKYYVVGYSDDHMNISHFRVDRMANVQILSNASQKKPKGFNPQKYATRVFGMYSADLRNVTLLCENDLLKDIFDKFGVGIQTNIVDEHHFQVTVEVEPSPPFFGWVFQYEGRIQVVGPHDVVKKKHWMCNALISTER